MQFKMTLILEMLIPFLIALTLVGCLGGGNGPSYDGSWTVVYIDTGFTTPPAASGATVTCTLPTTLPTVTLSYGVGSTSQTNTCTGTTTVSGKQDFIYLISVAITTSTGAVKAIVNGSPLTGQCISSVGCAAQSGTQSLSLTR